MPPRLSWQPMRTAPQTVARIWLNHLTLGPILAEGRAGRWYAPNTARQVWRWHRPVEPEALEPFSGWLPFEALVSLQAEDDAGMDKASNMPPAPMHAGNRNPDSAANLG